MDADALPGQDGNIQMPPGISTEEFFKMNELGRLEYLQDRLYKSALQRRGAGNNDHFLFQSNYKAMLQMMNSQLSGVRPQAAVGAILEEFHKKQAFANEDDEVELDRRVNLQGTRQANDATITARQLTAGMTGKDKGVPLGEKLAALMPTASRAVVDSAKASTVTVFRQQEVQVIHERDQRLKDLTKVMSAAVKDVKKQFLRSSSYPRAIYAVGPYSDVREEMQAVKARLIKVEKIAEGAAPREQEKRLEQKIAVLEEQITNQLALVRGLRERVKLVKAELAQRDAMASYHGGGSRHTSRATTPRDDGYVTPSGSSSSKVEGLRNAVGRRGGPLAPAAAPSAVTTAPRGDQCTVVIIDLDSAQFLWESVPELMRSQTELFSHAVRTQAAYSGGYEVANRDDRFIFVFNSPVDACSFALQLQQRLLDCDWSPLLAENVETPTELFPGSATQYLWRGLQAKIGIEVGAVAVTDPLIGKITYEGLPVDTAGYLEMLAVGGEILVSSAVADNIKDSMSALSDPVIIDWGNLSYHASNSRTLRMVPRHLEARKDRFTRHLVTAERALHDEQEDEAAEQVQPPQGGVTMVSVMFPYCDILRDEVSSDLVVRDTMQRCVHLVVRLAKSEIGYISYQNVDTMRFVIAFEDVLSALKFSIELQKVLMAQEWSNEVLRLTQFSIVRVKGNIIFNGPRVRIGVHRLGTVPNKFKDPLEKRTIFRAPDSKFSSYFACAAMDGEILISYQLVDDVMRNLDELDNPSCDFATDVSVPTSDALHRLFQLFPLLTKSRAAFVNRDMRLKDESQELANRDVLAITQEQVRTLQQKLEMKNNWVKRLDHQLDEKSMTIAQIRSFVLNMPFVTVDVRAELNLLDPTGGVAPPDYCICAISFANADELFDVEPQSMPEAVERYNELIDKAQGIAKGIELRRSPSQNARIVAFDEIPKAVEFWLYVTRHSNTVEWPLRLDDTAGAGQLMASELFPGLQPDSTIWRGLRPIGVIEAVSHTNKFNTITKKFDPLMDCINDVADKLAQCSDGDLIISPKLAASCRERLERYCTDVTLAEYGPFFRITDNLQRFRNRAMTQAFPPRGGSVLPPVRQGKYIVIHVMCHDHPQTHRFRSDLTVFDEVIMRAVMEFEGHIITTKDSEFVLAFKEPAKGVQFSIHVHTYLMQAMWTLEVRRVRDFRDQLIHNKIVARGMRAKVGVHYITQLSNTYDLFTGGEMWFHSTLSVPFLLANRAHNGETLLSEDAKSFLRRCQEEGHIDAFIEPCGQLILLDGKSDIYQAFPTGLRGRTALFIEEDRRKNNPEEVALAAKEDRVYQKRRERFAEVIQKDAQFLSDCERSLNPFDDPISKKTLHLHNHVKAQMNEDRGRFLTCLTALEVLESVNMMAEDQFYLGHQDKGLPYHTHLMLYEMETGDMAKNPIFKKAYAAELLGGDLVPDKPPELNGDGMTVVESSKNAFQRVVSGMLSAGASSAGAAPRRVSVMKQKEIDRTAYILPEDLALIHIDVERFYNLLKLCGTKDRVGFLREWTKIHSEVVPKTIQEADSSMEEMLVEMASQSATLGMAVSDVDVKIVRRSIVANLSKCYQEICGILGGSSVIHGKQERLVKHDDDDDDEKSFN